MSPVEPLAPWQTAWPAFFALGMLAWGAGSVRRRMRVDRSLLGVLAVALVVRALWMPLDRHVFDGHEAEYLDIFLGTKALTRGGPLLYPAHQWITRGLGLVLRHPTGLIGFSLLASLVSIGATWGWASRFYGRRVALFAAAILALWGNHAFWSSSAYNVVLPHAFSMVALWALVRLDDEDRSRAWALVAGGAGALAVATRVESIIWLPMGLVVLGVMRPRGIRLWLPPLAVGLLLGGVAMFHLLWPGTVPGEGQRFISLSNNLGLLHYFEPLHRPWRWVVVGVGAVCVFRRQAWITLGLCGLVVGSHLLFSTFDDYGFRHIVGVAPALAVLCAGVVMHPWTRLLGVPLGLWLLVHTADVAQRYYQSEEAFAASLDPNLPRQPLSSLGSCALICEDGRVLPEGEQKSHFNLLDPEEEHSLRQTHGCIQWLVGVQDARWSSRAVRDRAIRLGHLFEITPVAVVEGEDNGYVGLLVDVGYRRRGMGPP